LGTNSLIKIADFGETFHMAVSPVFRPWGGVQYLDTRVQQARVAEIVSQSDLVLLGGGGDIHPSLYGHTDVASGVGKGPSIRDNFEVEVVKRCREFGKPILGICRGAQMLCVQAGGSLIQHVDGHAGADHPVHVPDYLMDPIITNSVHHQMMVVPRRKANVIGYTENLSDRFLYDTEKIEFDPQGMNPEIVYFPELKGLAIQGHPEFYSNAKHPFVRLTRQMVQAILNINTGFNEPN
jgi:gamma-glutamyl-gamma-aminobutyrate hydrolase PuuD